MELINRLKEFYLLEVLQVTFYESQLNSLKKNDYLYHVYKLLVDRERGHVDYLKKAIQSYGGEVPIFTGGLLGLSGNVLGETMDFTSSQNRYELGIRIENKAVEMYRAFIMETWEEPDLNNMLWQFMIDEEFHLLWFKDNQKHQTSLVLR